MSNTSEEALATLERCLNEHRKLVELVRSAGEATLKARRGGLEEATKSDGSVVTRADRMAHQVFAEHFAKDPHSALVSEEDEASWQHRSQPSYWLTDPLDGTREYVSGSDDFTVNLARIDKGVPTLGFVGVPATGAVYIGDVAERLAIRIDPNGEVTRLNTSANSHGRQIRVISSVSHPSDRDKALLQRIEKSTGQPIHTETAGSSVKIIRVAEGKVDLYPRLAPTCEWDVAAAHAVVVAAGGQIWGVGGVPLSYGSPEHPDKDVVNSEFLVVGDAERDWCGELDLELRQHTARDRIR